jgi:hypothetical protein
MKTEDYPYLEDYVGHTLITSDGTTLIGADDKAGIAEILTMLEKLIAKYPKTPAANSAKALLKRLHKETCVDLEAYKKRFGLHIDVHHYCWWAAEKMEKERNAVIAEILKFPEGK